MDSKFHVPELDRNNPTFWKLAFESNATTLDALSHISSNPNPPQDPALLFEYNKHRHILRPLILSTVPPPDILKVLTDSSDPSLKELLDPVLLHLKTNKATDHKYLESEADNLRFTPGMTIEDYITKHNNLRARMIGSQFPNITDESTSVDFMIDGLRYNSDTIDIGRLTSCHKSLYRQRLFTSLPPSQVLQYACSLPPCVHYFPQHASPDWSTPP